MNTLALQQWVADPENYRCAPPSKPEVK